MMSFQNRNSLLTPLTPSMPLCPPIAEQIEELPITPPDLADTFDETTFKPDSTVIRRALHVLATERNALTHLEELYRTSPDAQTSLIGAINQIIHSETNHGKVIFTGIGKSGHIATKLAATFNSLGIQSTCLHPTEALHGDLGMIRPNDTFVMITFSGRTPELLTLVSHIPSSVPLILMSSHTNPATCPLLFHRSRINGQNFLLPTMVHESETLSFGISAPTTSTTITLALGDSLALAVADKLHSNAGVQTPDVFAANHPGGAIGAAFAGSASSSPPPPLKATAVMSNLATLVSDIPIATSSRGPGQPLKCLDILLTAARSPSGFVRVSPIHLVAPRRIQKMLDPDRAVEDLYDDLGKVVIENGDWISILGASPIDEARNWVLRMRNEGDGRGKQFLRHGTVLAIVENNLVTGVAEIEDLLGEDFV